jgi:hypothetical protein
VLYSYINKFPSMMKNTFDNYYENCGPFNPCFCAIAQKHGLIPENKPWSTAKKMIKYKKDMTLPQSLSREEKDGFER